MAEAILYYHLPYKIFDSFEAKSQGIQICKETRSLSCVCVAYITKPLDAELIEG